MKKLVTTIMLIVVMLVGSGCAQEDRIQPIYKIKSTPQGVAVQMNRASYKFTDDIKQVWNAEDKQFRNHTIFWTTVCVHPFFGTSFTKIPTQTIQLIW